MKRLLSVILMLAMLLTLVPLGAFAAKSYEPTTEELEEVIKKVRTTLEIPKEQTEFSWDYNSASYYSQSSWYLTWADTDYSYVTYINCDNEGNILSYNLRDNRTTRRAALPEKAPDCEEYVNKAKAFISKIAPYTDGHLELYEARMSTSLRYHTYSYTFVRVENDIIVPDNAVYVEIDYTTGNILSASVVYDKDVSFAKPEGIISLDKAKEILSQKQSMKLSYKIKHEYDNDGYLKSIKAYLVYTPEVSYVSVDAKTGEIYTERNTWEILTQAPNQSTGSLNGDASFDKAESEAASPEAGRGYELSEQELAQLEVLNSLISRDQAIKAVTGNKYLYLDSDATAIEAQLQRRKNYSDNTEQFIWRVSFSKPYDETTGYSRYANATANIDAKTGKLISYSANLPNYYDYEDYKIDMPTINYTQEQACDIASEFLKSVDAERFALTKQGVPYPVHVLKYELAENGEFDYNKPIYRSYDVSYIRVNEGVDFPYNNLNTCVDLVTGKITTYSTTWYDNVTFESPKDAITPAEALEAYHNCEGFGINYEINSTYTYNKYLTDKNNGEFIDYDELYSTSLNTRAVYSAYNMGTNIIGALNGKMLTYGGEEYIPYERMTYSDIDGHWAKDIIERFAYADIGFTGGKCNPDSAITALEFSQILNSCGIYGIYSDYRQDISDDSSITRADAVKFIISYLGYEKVATLQNVFITDFADNSNLKAEDVGFIAIARGFGLINGDAVGFRPYDILTRAEALQLCLNLLGTDMLN